MTDLLNWWIEWVMGPWWCDETGRWVETWSGEDQFLDCHATNDIQLRFSESTFTFWVKFCWIIQTLWGLMPGLWWNVMKCDEMMNLVMTHTFPSSNEILAEDDDSAPFVGKLELSKWVETFYNKPHNSQNSGQLLACRVRWIPAIKRGSQRSFSPDMTENVQKPAF